MDNVTFIRDPFTESCWHVFVPLDSVAGKYIRYDLEPPQGLASLKKYIAISQVMYGVVRPGKVFIGNATTPEWVESGTWSNSFGGGMYYRQSSVDGNYVEMVIPNNMNRISLVSYNVASGGGANLAIGWYDSDGNALSNDDLLITSYDSGGTATGTADVLVATGAKSNGVKRLRITLNDASGSARLCGVRCWNTNAIGDPATEISSGSLTSFGHDIVDSYTTSIRRIRASDRPIKESILLTIVGTSFESAINWCQTSVGTGIWSGGWYHVDDDGAQFVHVSGSSALTNGPSVVVDGTTRLGTAQMARNTLYSGVGIDIRCSGFYDYDNDGVQDTGDPNVTFCLHFTACGVSNVCTVQWTDSMTITTLYSPMFNFSSEVMDLSPILKFLPDDEEYALDANTTSYMRCNSCEVFIPRLDLVLRLDAVGPIHSVYWVGSTSKLYIKYAIDYMPGNTTPLSGDVWSFGGRWEFRKAKWTPEIMRNRRIWRTGHPMERQWP